MNVGIVNAHMFGRGSEPGEHVDWSKPDVESRETWRSVLEMDVEDYAALAPHMIVFEIDEPPQRVRQFAGWAS